MVPRLLLVVLFAAACYDPSPHASCAIACDFAGAGTSAPCPNGLVCGPHGRCASATDDCDAVDAGTTDGALGDAAICFGALPGQEANEVCLASPPAGERIITVPITTSDCSIGMHVMIAGLRYCVVAAARINVSVSVTATGSDPLLLLATESITIDTFGSIDASTRHNAPLGAGGNWSGCATGIDASTARGGGAGGSFQGAGANGGGPGAGVRAPSTLAKAFHGGCSGGKSGGSTMNGGRGGGALFLSAPRITVRGALAASGQGGEPGGAVSNGGGGGGSGGMITLIGATIEIDSAARLIASGGGGGGGRDGGTGVALPGESASATDPSPQGGDGQSAAVGGDGSQPFDINGAQGSTSNDSNAGGGGGGGGGAGYIVILEGGAPKSCSPFACIPAAAL